MKIMKYINYIILIITVFLINYSYSFANINLTVSPIKYEIETTTWSIITKTATLFNRSDQVHTIYTSKSDFESKDNTWNPRFVRKSELVFDDQELASWINIDTNSFVIQPGEQKDITFTINVPENATPGWHYWAVFFKNNNSEQSSWSQISINVDYWVLLLVNVAWEIITKWEIEDTIITNNNSWSWWWWGYSWLKKDDCKIDLTVSRYDWKCIDNFFENDELVKEIENLDLWNESDITSDDFNINFETLFVNEWNTHLKPTWKITLVDENWKEIKWVWKEVIKNDEWAIIWEKIVDYLPINDNWWNVLPNTKRNFESEWKWFPYESYDANWKKIIKYWNPEEYYTRINREESWLLMIWQRENERINHEKINANIELWYTDKDWELVEFNSAKEFYVDYKEKYIWLNPYFFIILWFILFIWFFFFILFRKKKYKCISCKKKIDEDMKICPYCWTKQDDHRFLKNKESKKDIEENTKEEVEKNKNKKK